MKVTIESTEKVVNLNGVPARIWEGQTDSGIPLHAFVTRVAVAGDQNHEQFQKELQEHTAPSPEVRSYDPRMIL